MINFTDFLMLAGMFLLRFGVPALIVVGLGLILKRLDARWEAQAWAEQEKSASAEAPVQQPVVQPPAERPAPSRRVPAQQPVLPFIPPQVRDVPRQQPGLMTAQVAQPCWDVKGCSDAAKAQCAAPQSPDKPCWQARMAAEGAIPEDCVSCEIFQRYPMM